MASSKLHRYYGRKDIALFCKENVTRYFARTLETTCTASTSKIDTRPPPPEIGEWIAYVLYRTALPLTTCYHALHLLHRLSQSFDSDPRSPSPPLFHHRLVFSAFVLACKYAMDDAYSNKSWAVASRDVFNVREISEMELSMLKSLDWVLREEGEDLDEVLQHWELNFEAWCIQREEEREREREREREEWKRKAMNRYGGALKRVDSNCLPVSSFKHQQPLFTPRFESSTTESSPSSVPMERFKSSSNSTIKVLDYARQARPRVPRYEI
ncbi:hypothetical protein BT69DRAFT_1284444 [Atractiella rhizophila]|nr:hypothetical protein BT69DRAFT_1284444 [Atractiella rhizophila]